MQGHGFRILSRCRAWFIGSGFRVKGLGLGLRTGRQMPLGFTAKV